MPWCPVCKNEYKAGFTICSDCKVNLVDELEDSKVLLTFGNEEEIDQIINFFSVNDLMKGVEKTFDATENQFEIRVDEDKYDVLRKRLALYYREFKADRVQETINNLKTEESDKEIKAYKDPAKRAEEYKSGAASLLIVGIVGAILLILIDINVIKLYFTVESKVLINVVMGFIFAIFIVCGIKSFGSYKKLLGIVETNSNLESQIMSYFTESVTQDMIASNSKEDDGQEVLYFNRTKVIRTILHDNFPDIDDSFAEYLIEKIYSDKFDD